MALDILESNIDCFSSEEILLMTKKE